MAVTLKCNSCNIVIDELLAYIQNKISLCDEGSLVKICVSVFTSEEIEKSKSLLFESIPADKRKPVRKGQGKENRALSDIISVFKTLPDLLPVFVARNLEKLPPITFDHLDVSDLLKRLMILQSDVQNLKASYVSIEQLEELRREFQSSLCHNVNSLCDTENVNMNLRINANFGAEKPDNNVDDSLLMVSNLCDQTISNHGSNEQSHVHNLSDEGTSKALFSTNLTAAGTPAIQRASGSKTAPVELVDESSPAATSAPSKQLLDVIPDNTKSSQLVSKPSSSGQWTTVTYRRRNNRKVRGKFGIGSDSSGNFKAAERKVPIFISNIHVNTTEHDILQYISAKTNVYVKLERIISKKQQLHKSYKFFVPMSMEKSFLEDDFWPNGIIFRRFLHYKNPHSVNKIIGNGPALINNGSSCLQNSQF